MPGEQECIVLCTEKFSRSLLKPTKTYGDTDYDYNIIYEICTISAKWQAQLFLHDATPLSRFLITFSDNRGEQRTSSAAARWQTTFCGQNWLIWIWATGDGATCYTPDETMTLLWSKFRGRISFTKWRWIIFLGGYVSKWRVKCIHRQDRERNLTGHWIRWKCDEKSWQKGGIVQKQKQLRWPFGRHRYL